MAHAKFLVDGSLKRIVIKIFLLNDVLSITGVQDGHEGAPITIISDTTTVVALTSEIFQCSELN